MHLWPLFWGCFFIMIGINIILRTFFNINIPFFRVAFAVLVIFVGIAIIFPGIGEKFTPRGVNGAYIDERTTMFGEAVIEGDKVKGEHSVVFGSLKLDLSKVEIKEKIKIKIDTVFGGTEIKIDPAKPIRITGSAAFGGIVLPNGNSAAFGSTIYQSDSYKEGAPALLLDVNAVFGGVEIKGSR